VRGNPLITYMEILNRNGVEYSSRSYNYATRQFELWGVAEDGKVVYANENENFISGRDLGDEDDGQLTLELEEAKIE